MRKWALILLVVPLCLGAQTKDPSQDTVVVTATPNQGRVLWNDAVKQIPGVYNVKAFGATGAGTGSDRVAIQSALTAAGTLLLHGIVYLPAGVYVVDTTHNLENSPTVGSLFIPSNVTVCGDGPGQTVIRRAANSGNGVHLLMNYHVFVTSDGDSNIIIKDLTLDGNGANNPVSAHQAQSTLSLTGVKGALVQNVVIVDTRGTDTGGAGESFALDINQSSNVTVEHCEAIGKTYSSSGFSCNSALNVSFISCVSHGFFATGFTCYGSRSILYVNCWAYQNIGYTGFNSETNAEISYMNCVAGGYTTSLPTVFFPSDTSIGNTHGFVVGGAMHPGAVIYTSCIAKNNVCNGLYAATGSARMVIVNGGIWDNNGCYGIDMEDPADSVEYSITGNPEIRGNSAGNGYQVLFHNVNYYAPSKIGSIDRSSHWTDSLYARVGTFSKILNSITSTQIDSFKVVADSLQIWIGGNPYLAKRRGF